MFALRSWKELGTRALLIAVMSFNALGLTTVVAKPLTTENVPVDVRKAGDQRRQTESAIHTVPTFARPVARILERDVPGNPRFDVSEGCLGVEWFDTAWAYRRRITFYNDQRNLWIASENLVSFPVNVTLSDQNFDFSLAQSQGQDIRFSDSDGITLLSYEIERWDATNNTATLWVKVPQIDIGSIDFIYMYYGNAQAVDAQSKTLVWDANYRLVHHLSDTDSVVLDSTANGNNGTKRSASELLPSAGVFAGAQTFDGSNDYYNIPDSASLDITTGITLDLWINPLNDGAGHSVVRKGSKTAGLYYIFLRSGAIRLAINDIGWDYGGYRLPSLGAWYHVVGTYDGTARRMYVNGVLRDTRSQPGSIGTNSAGVGVGQDGSWQEYLRGTIDELRIVNGAKSGAWIAAEYSNGVGQFLAYWRQETQDCQEFNVFSGSILNSGNSMSGAGAPIETDSPSPLPLPN